MALTNCVIQILKSVLLVSTTVLNSVWNCMEGMSVIVLMDMNWEMMESLVKVCNNMTIIISLL